MNDSSPLIPRTTWHIEGYGGAYDSKLDAAYGQTLLWLQNESDLSEGVARKVVEVLFASPSKYLDMLSVAVDKPMSGGGETSGDPLHGFGSVNQPHPGKAIIVDTH